MAICSAWHSCKKLGRIVGGLFMQVGRRAGRCGLSRSAKPVEVPLLVRAKSVMHPNGNVAAGFGNINYLCCNEPTLWRVRIKHHGVRFSVFTGSLLIVGFHVCLKVSVVQRNADSPQTFEEDGFCGITLVVCRFGNSGAVPCTDNSELHLLHHAQWDFKHGL